MQMITSLLIAALAGQGVAHSYLQGIITGYGSASNDPTGSSTICCGLEGSENAATYDNPGVVASDNSKYPVGTMIYIPGLQKYFKVLDSCADCQNQAVHFDIWVGPTGYQDYNSLLKCAENDGASSATIILDPNPGYTVDGTPLMDANGNCDSNVDYSRTTPSGGSPPPSNPQPVTSSAAVAPSNPPSGGGGGSCDWPGHCQGAPCQTYNDCGDPFSCVNSVCT